MAAPQRKSRHFLIPFMIYDSPLVYQLIMRLLYGSGFQDRYRAVLEEIPDGAEVLDLCCGDCHIYTHYLKQKNVRYSGLDMSPGFERSASKHGISFRVCDLSKAEIPAADYILMMGSLYQFYDRAPEMIQKLLKQARKKLIIAEPIVNLSQSTNPVLAKLAQRLTHSQKRFDENSLQALLHPHQAIITKTKKIANGREMLVVFEPGPVPSSI